MTERFCKDCPCLIFLKDDPKYPMCTLLPDWEEIRPIWLASHYCYTGRQIMAEQASWQRAKAALQPSTTADQVELWPAKKEDD